MMNENSIVITPVANGFVVIMPSKKSNEMPMPMPDMTQIFRDIKKEFHGEDILEEIKNRNLEQSEELLKSVKPPLGRDEDTHIFIAFDEVLLFLKHQVI